MCALILFYEPSILSISDVYAWIRVLETIHGRYLELDVIYLKVDAIIGISVPLGG